MKNMKPLLLFLFISISLEALAVSATGNNIDAYSPTNDIAVNCGSPSNSSVSDRTWIGDAADGSSYSPSDETRSSIIASANRSSPSFHSGIPYDTARLSRSEFAYASSLSTYLNFRRADSFFSVKAAGHTLLRNFSASLFSNYNGSMSFHKEFCLTVGRPFSSGSDVRPLVKTGNRLQLDHSTVWALPSQSNG
ncbi:putative receptor-like protein kinase At5g39000 [Syzygium oleosum]|uniref:putative receptor-like protein kinase At5g39000 n=1 Tax=Syzygium oleosum TaxID=219896 RepID=UPI0024BAB3B2|nr:putative receptor-like protein kinase At5g39000 [Syzygium oleosum]